MNILNMYQKYKVKVRVATCIIFLQLNKLIVFADTKGKNEKTSEAGDIGSTKLVTGTVNLANDITTALLILSPIVGGAFMAYFFVRKNGADESDQKQWDKRIKTSFFCIIGALCIGGLIKSVLSYYM